MVRANPTTWHTTPLYSLVVTCIAVLVGEIGVMFILPTMRFLPPVAVPYVDGLLLTVMVTPFLYFLLYRPLVHTISEHQRAQDALSVLNTELESRVKERTAELQTAFIALEKKDLARQEVEKRLRQSNEFTQRLVECAPCLMAVIEVKNLRCSYVNGRIRDLLGYEPEEITLADSSFLELIASANDHAKLVGFVRAVATGRQDESLAAKIDLRNRDGQSISSRIALSALSRAGLEPAEEVLMTAVLLPDAPAN